MTFGKRDFCVRLFETTGAGLVPIEPVAGADLQPYT